MASHEPTHLRGTRCLLCRHSATDGDTILDPDGVYYTAHSCQRRCVYCDGYPTPHLWLHQPCYELLRASYPPNAQPSLADLEDFADATARVYKSPSTNSAASMVACIREGLLCDSVRGVLHDCFRQELLQRLPAEVLDLIAEAIGQCSYLTVLGESRRLIEELRRNHHRQNHYVVVDLNHDVYIKTVEFRGRSYISYMGNTPLPNPINARHHHLSPPGTVQRMVLCTSHSGIHSIRFMKRKDTPCIHDRSPGKRACYQIIDSVVPRDRIELVHHGLFVHVVQFCFDSTKRYELSTTQRWDTPHIPHLPDRNVYRPVPEALFSYLPLDYSRLKGLVVGILSIVEPANVALFPWPPAVPSVDGYAATPRRFSPYWRYFPIHPGEYIQNVWIRKRKKDHKKPSYPEFALQTTRGRYALFAEYPAYGWVRNQYAYELLPLTHPDDGLVSGLCHNGLDPESTFISGYGVTCDLADAPKTPSSELPTPNWYPYPPPQPPSPRLEPMCIRYMTRAPLRGLSEVQACWSVARYYRRCLGLLLHYEDGTQESVGQFRWDQRMSERIPAPIRLHVGRLGPWKKNQRFVLHVQSAGGLRLPWGRWVDLPDSGFLVWWSGAIGDVVEMQRT